MAPLPFKISLQRILILKISRKKLFVLAEIKLKSSFLASSFWSLEIFVFVSDEMVIEVSKTFIILIAVVLPLKLHE